MSIQAECQANTNFQLADIEPHSEFNSSDISPVCPGSADIHTFLIYLWSTQLYFDVLKVVI